MPDPTTPPARPPALYAPPSAASRGPRRKRIRIGPILWAILALGLLAWIPWQRCGVTGCPDVSRLGAYLPQGAPQVLDRHGQPIGELQLSDRVVVELETLPTFVTEAFVAVEDRRFYQHRGIDWRRIPSAMWANVRARDVAQGSSTITMQLARNVFSERLPAHQRTLGRKLLEVRVARAIERAFDKEEILELYLNHIYFGGGSQGIEAASRLYFGHGAAELTLAQASLLAALPKAPTHYDPRRHRERAQQRRNLVLNLMEEQERVSPAEAEVARATEVQVVGHGSPIQRQPPFAGYFMEQVRRELEEQFGDSLYRNPIRIVTTLDRNVQQIATGELLRQLRDIEHGASGPFRGPVYGSSIDFESPEQGTPYLQGAMVVLEADTGDVLAWIGGRDFGHSRFDRLEQGRRQVGSAFKPFVYAAALAAGHPMSERISDQPLTVELAGGEVWRPANFAGQYQEYVTLREGLVHSKNVATVRLGQQVGVHRSIQMARDAGIERNIPAVPSAVLGSATVSPLELTSAFTAFANLGQATKPRLILRIEDPEGGLLWEAPTTRRSVMPPAVAYLITDALRDAVNRGTGSAARAAGYRGPAAGKTGTTNEQQDVWFVGYTPDLVAGLWIGFDRPRTIVPRATGGRLAAPVWGRVMHRIYQLRAVPADWALPANVVERRVDPATGLLFPEECAPPDAYSELFVRGIEPRMSSCPGSDRLLALFGRWRDGLWERFYGDRGEDEDGMYADDGLRDDLPRLGWQGEPPHDPSDAFRERGWNGEQPLSAPPIPETLEPIEIEIEPVEIEPVEIEPVLIEPVEIQPEAPAEPQEEPAEPEGEEPESDQEREEAERQRERERAEEERERERRERERQQSERRPPPDGSPGAAHSPGSPLDLPGRGNPRPYLPTYPSARLALSA